MSWRQLGCASVVIALLPLLTAHAQWTVIDLHPTGAVASKVNAIRDGVQVGEVDGSAAKWSGTAASYIDLGGRAAYGTDGMSQVGAGDVSAALWTGTLGSQVDLTPPPPAPPATYADSRAMDVDGGVQVGTTWRIEPFIIGAIPDAGIWTGTGASWTSLTPLGPSSSIGSTGEGSHNGVQVGSVQRHAAMWFGTAESFVDLNPMFAISSIAYDVHNGAQVGSANFGTFGFPRAILWKGTAASFRDLTSDVITSGEALGVYDFLQVGYIYDDTTSNQTHASLWAGTSDSLLDLHAFLPVGYTASRAEGVWISDAGVAYVAGWAVNSLGNAEAKLWVGPAIPEPTSWLILVATAPWVLRASYRGPFGYGRRRLLCRVPATHSPGSPPAPHPPTAASTPQAARAQQSPD